MSYEVTEDGQEIVQVEVEEEGKVMKKPWNKFMKENVDARQHEIVRKNVLLATRNFNHRVQEFRKTVVFGANSPMRVRHISYRVEFQGRGAGHIHGVLWVDLKQVRVKEVDSKRLMRAFEKLKDGKTLDQFEQEDVERYTDAFVTCSRNPEVVGKRAVEIAEEVNCHNHSKSCKKSGHKCRFNFPKFPLPRTRFVDKNREYEEGEKLSVERRTEILEKVASVLVEEEGGKVILSKEVKKIVREANTKNSNKLFKTHETKSKEAEAVQPVPAESSGEFKRKQARIVMKIEEKVGERTFIGTTETESYVVKEIGKEKMVQGRTYTIMGGTVVDRDVIETSKKIPAMMSKVKIERITLQEEREQLMKKVEKMKDQGEEVQQKTSEKDQQKTSEKQTSLFKTQKNKEAEAVQPVPAEEEEVKKTKENCIISNIDKLLKVASGKDEHPIMYEEYIKAVHQQPSKGSGVLLKRDIDEIFMNNYNPEWLEAWDANMDLQPVFDHYAVLTYVTDYFTKDSTGLTDVLKAAAKELPKDGDAVKKCHDLATVFMSHRQVGEAEVYYKLFPSMRLNDSSVTTQFIPTEPKKDRMQFLKKQDPEQKKGFKVKGGGEGLYLEVQDMVSKYERRKLMESEEDGDGDDVLESLSFCQFARMYRSKTFKKWTAEDNDEWGGEGEASHRGDDDVDEGELDDDDKFNYVMTGEAKCFILYFLISILQVKSRKRRSQESYQR